MLKTSFVDFSQQKMCDVKSIGIDRETRVDLNLFNFQSFDNVEEIINLGAMET